MLPDDPSSVPVFMAPALERLAAAPAGDGGPAVLVVTADSERAAAVAAEVVRVAGPGTTVVAATSVGRAARVIGAGGPAVVIGSPDVIVGLMGKAVLKLGGLRAVVIAWVDDVLRAGGEAALEAVMAEAPKDAPRTIVAAAESPEVEALIERYARRPRRIAPPAVAEGDVSPSVSVRYVSVTPEARAVALRRLLDDMDPPSAIISVRTEASERVVRETLDALGYAADGVVQVRRGAIGAGASMIVLYDVPLDAQELHAAVQGAPAHVVALVERRELARLRRIAGGATPLVLSGPVAAAKRRIHELRDEIRQVLDAGLPASEVLDIEPLLSGYDAIEIAAAALHLLRRQQLTVVPRQTAAPAPRPAAAERGPRDRDERPRGGDRPRGGRPRGDRPLGDRPRGDRPLGDRPRGDRPLGDRPRGDRPLGDRSRGDRPLGDRPRGDRDRPRSGERGDRPQSGERGGRGERPRSGESRPGEWSQRGERLRHARRDPNARGPRGRGDGDRGPRGQGPGD